MVIAVTVVVAGIVIFLVQGESGDFSDWLGETGQSAQCDYYQNQIDRDEDLSISELNEETEDDITEDCNLDIGG